MNRLTSEHHTISRLLLSLGCMSQEQITTELQLHHDYDAADDIDIEQLINSINRWNESNRMGLQIENYSHIDGKTYYGWRAEVIDDDIAKQSMQSLNEKQLKFWKILLNIAISNSALFTFQSALHLNKSGLLAIKNILTIQQLEGLITMLEKGKYIELIQNNEFDANNNNNNVDDADKYYVLGPRTFIDTQVWLDSKTAYTDNECVLCSDYVVMRGYKCPQTGCIMHGFCITEFLQSNNNRNKFNCPKCQCSVSAQNSDASQYIDMLQNPNNAIKLIDDLKTAKRNQREESKTMAQDDDDEDDDINN